MNRLVGYCFFVFVSMAGCRHKDITVSKEEYLAYVNERENGVITEKTFNGVMYQLRYITPDMMVLKKHHFQDVSQENLVRERSDFSFTYYFDLIVKDESGSSRVKQLIGERARFSEFVEYVNSEFSKNLMLVSDQDTMACSVCHLEPPSSLNPEMRFALAFQPRNNSGLFSQNCQLILIDEVFKSGPLKFSFSASDIHNIPQVSL